MSDKTEMENDLEFKHLLQEYEGDLANFVAWRSYRTEKLIKSLPCQNPDAPCPKGVTMMSVSKKAIGAIIGGIGAVCYGVWELVQMVTGK